MCWKSANRRNFSAGLADPLGQSRRWPASQKGVCDGACLRFPSQATECRHALDVAFVGKRTAWKGLRMLVE